MYHLIDFIFLFYPRFVSPSPIHVITVLFSTCRFDLTNPSTHPDILLIHMCLYVSVYVCVYVCGRHVLRVCYVHPANCAVLPGRPPPSVRVFVVTSIACVGFPVFLRPQVAEGQERRRKGAAG